MKLVTYFEEVVNWEVLYSQGFLDMLELASIDYLHWGFATDWLNVVHIKFLVLNDYDKLLTLCI